MSGKMLFKNQEANRTAIDTEKGTTTTNKKAHKIKRHNLIYRIRVRPKYKNGA